MIVYAIVLLTDIEDVHKAERIEIRFGTVVHNICGDVVRDFVKCTNHAYHDYPFQDCLAYGLTLVPPELREIFAHLYETLKETIVWNEPENTFE